MSEFWKTIASKALTYPLVYAGFNLQVYPDNISLQNQDFEVTGAVDMIRATIQQMGFEGLYRGFLIDVGSEFLKQKVAPKVRRITRQPKYYEKNFFVRLLLSYVPKLAIAACLQCILLPIKVVHLRVVADATGVEFEGFVDCFSKLTLAGGIENLYTGFWCALTGVFIYRVVYAETELMLKKKVTRLRGKRWICNTIAVPIALLAVYPIATVLKRVHM